MRHAGTQEIETPRLILRRLLSEDANRMYVNWANDLDVTRFLRWEPHKNAAETRQLLAAWATLYPNPDYYQWAIVEKASGQVFGTISIYNSLAGGAPAEGRVARAGHFRGHLGAGLLHRQRLVEQGLYHRSPPRGCRILVQKYK